MTDLFISDLHLDEAQPQITQQFLQFLAGPGTQARRLYILGDLFEYWVGDDHDTPLHQLIADALHNVASAGTQIFYMAGNRDFLLGKDYARRAGFAILDDPTAIELNAQTVVLCHGDTLCTDDVEYQAFRRQVRDTQWQQDFLGQSLSDRIAYAQQARDASGAYTAQAADTIMDVNPAAVVDLFRQQQAVTMIHGHTHRPAVHEASVDGRTTRRIVLGAWHDGSETLVADDSGLNLLPMAQVLQGY